MNLEEALIEDKDIFKKSVEVFGVDAQLRKCSQECIELALAISKYLDDGEPIINIIEEMVDVEIMINQIPKIYKKAFGLGIEFPKFEYLYQKYLRLKIIRLKRLIKDAEYKKGVENARKRK